MSSEYQALLNNKKYKSLTSVNGVKVVQRSSFVYSSEIKKALDEIFFERLLKEGHCTICNAKTSKFCVNCGTHYCGIRCQLSDWSNHEPVCAVTPSVQDPASNVSFVESNGSHDSGSKCRRSQTVTVCDKVKTAKNQQGTRGEDSSSSSSSSIINPDVKHERTPKGSMSPGEKCIKRVDRIAAQVAEVSTDRPSTTENSEVLPKISASENIGNRREIKSRKVKTCGSTEKLQHAEETINKEPRESATVFSGFNEWKLARQNDSYLPGEIITVKCGHWDRNGLCWVIPQENLPILEQMQTYLSQNYINYQFMDPKLNDLFIVRYDGEWCRARLIADEPKVIIHCIDFGIKFTPRFLRCREIRGHIASVERLAFPIQFVEPIVNDRDKRETITIEIVGVGENEIYKVKMCKTLKVLGQDVEKIDEKSTKEKSSSDKGENENLRRCVVDDLEPGMSGIFTPMQVVKKEMLGCLVPEDIDDAKFCYKKISSLYCLEADKTDAEVGDVIMVGDCDNSGQRAVVKSKSKENGYTASLIDYGCVVNTAKVYKLPENLTDLTELACKITLKPANSKSFECERDTHYFFTVKSKTSEGKWLCTLQDELDSEAAVAEGFIEKLDEYASGREKYIPFESGCKVIISEICEDSTNCYLYVRRVDGDFLNQFESLGEKINNLPENSNENFWNSVGLGDIVCARYLGDGQWYRARVQSKEGDDMHVFFIDYGNEDIVMKPDLKPLPSDLKDEPIFACKVPLIGPKKCISLRGFEFLQGLAEEFRELAMVYDGNISNGVLLTDEEGVDINQIVFDDSSSEESLAEKFTQYSDIVKNNFRQICFSEGPMENFLILHVDESEFTESGVFWAADPQNKNFNFIITKLNSEIGEYCRTLEAKYSPKIGELCFALYEDEWYRGMVVKENGEALDVFFVDFGNTSVVDRGSIRKMLPLFFEIPPSAVRCILAGYEKLRKDQLRSACKYLKTKINDCIKTVTITKAEEHACHVHLPGLLDNLN